LYLFKHTDSQVIILTNDKIQIKEITTLILNRF